MIVFSAGTRNLSGFESSSVRSAHSAGGGGGAESASAISLLRAAFIASGAARGRARMQGVIRTDYALVVLITPLRMYDFEAS